MKGLLLNYQYGMWDAVLAKIKTNTRRSHKSLEPVNTNPDNWELLSIRHSAAGDGAFARFKPKNGGAIVECRARYQEGEVSFLQEPTMNVKGFVTEDDLVMYLYRDDNGQDDVEQFKQIIDKAKSKGASWGNKMFMGEKDARYFIKIKRIEVQRLQDISDTDCFAEGIRTSEVGQYYFLNNGKKVVFDTVQKAYFSLYNTINRNAPVNPWVFSYHFERCSKNG
jgi:hypothetical protein